MLHLPAWHGTGSRWPVQLPSALTAFAIPRVSVNARNGVMPSAYEQLALTGRQFALPALEFTIDSMLTIRADRI